MAIQENAQPTLSATYVPGSKTWLQPICVEAGDRLYLIQMKPSGDISPDGTAGAGVGYMPHWAYRPSYMREQDLHDPPQGANLYDGVNGNAGDIGSAPIRVDLGYLYCPWAGQVTIEGGAGGNPVQIAYGWDQTGRARHGWWRTVAEVFWRIMGRSPREGHLKMPRVPVDMRASAGMTLTFYNAEKDNNGNTFPITRPAWSTCVWTPTTESLILSNGGATTTTVRTFGQSNRATLGAYTIITPDSTGATEVIFSIDL